MAAPKLGKLQHVDIRELWKHEQYDFSDWLAKSDNVEYLNEVLGLNLIEIEKEVSVGSYRCDLVAKDETTGTRVIIENQLESSDHDHLGKIITYASGINASVIVWIVREAREEHRSAVEWLNNVTNADVGFFLIEIHAYKIGDSLPAPMFEVVEQPNDFIKTNRNSSSSGELAEREVNRYEFWTKFNEHLIEKGKPFNPRKATTYPDTPISIGTSEARMGVNLVNRENKIVLDVYIYNNKDLFDKLFDQKDQIEKELGFTFDWDRLDGKKASRIKHDIPGLDFNDHSNYPQLMDETIDKLDKMRDVFKKYL